MLLPAVFTERVIEDLSEIGELEDGQACHLKRRDYSISGYELNDEEGRLDLFVTLFTGAQKPDKIAPKAIDGAIDGAITFFDEARNGLHRKLEEASPAFDMALRIAESAGIDRIRVFVFTDAVSKEVDRPAGQRSGALVSYHVWDLEGLFRIARSGVHPEPIDLDISSIGQFEVPCIEAPVESGDYRAYLAILPGRLLAAVYAAYGPRLLELNVRSYLQARGKVNAGIRRTIINEPEHFLAYNNGIAITASKVSMSPGKAGTLVLDSMEDMQIVNGGQTTASIFLAWRKDKADLSNLSVAAKITVVPAHLIDEFVPFVSRYANSQNKVNEADFAANDSFHVSVEKMSRSVWAPAPEGTQRMTKWFYERARGSYADAIARQETTARREAFKVEFPPSQKFTKTDLAKFENSWDQLPYLVSRGAEKNFQEFAIVSGRTRRAADDSEYKDIIARAILFRSTEKIFTKLGLVGYRANVVAYSIAYLAHATESRLDFERIWQVQGLPPVVAAALEQIVPQVYKTITEPPSRGNVGEWAKREACWDAVRDLTLRLADLSGVLVALGQHAPRGATRRLDPEEEAQIAEVASVSAEGWFAISNWAKETSHLQPWQRALAFSLGKLAKQHRQPSPKQAAQGEKILAEVRRLGFRFNG